MHLDEQDSKWHLLGKYSYLLRPETVESVFVAWRVTGDQRYRDYAWRIFSAIQQLQVPWSGGFCGVEDVRLITTQPKSPGRASTDTNLIDLQPSYFLAETLK
jgi:mannosyl-oligosaccharide alpha-1,2-mannosidase